MITVQSLIYDFPADDGGAMAERVCEAVPRAYWPYFDFAPYGGYRVMLDPISAPLLRLFIGNLGVAGAQHPFLSRGDLFVPNPLRQPCEEWIEREQRGPAAWSELYQLDVWDPRAQASFDSLHQMALAARRAGRR